MTWNVSVRLEYHVIDAPRLHCDHCDRETVLYYYELCDDDSEMRRHHHVYNGMVVIYTRSDKLVGAELYP